MQLIVWLLRTFDTSLSASLPVIPGYNLTEPTEDDARAALQRVFGAAMAETLWKAACVEALLLPGRVGPGVPLGRVADALAAQGGAAAMVARSIEIRMRTYYRLAERERTLAQRATS